MTTIIFARVSTERQDTESQKAALREWAKKDGGVHEWMEETVSGASTVRPVWRSICNRIEAGEVERLVVFSKDRLGRDFADRLRTLAMLQGAGVELVSLTEDTDTSSLEGLLMECMRAYVAASERRSIRQRTSAGIRASIARGRPWGGSKIDPSAKRGRRKLDDAAESSLCEMIRNGTRVSDAAKFWNIPRTTACCIYRRRSVVDNPPTAG